MLLALTSHYDAVTRSKSFLRPYFTAQSDYQEAEDALGQVVHRLQHSLLSILLLNLTSTLIIMHWRSYFNVQFISWL